MEYEQHPNLAQPVDILKMLNETYVSSVIKNTNAELLWPTTDSDEAVEALIRNLRMVLEQAFGDDYLDEPATVNGIAYQADHQGNPTGDEVYFYGKELIYCGPTVQVIDDIPQVVIELYDDKACDHTDASLEKIYYMLPKGIDKFDISPTEKIIDIIARHTVQSRRLLSSTEFLQAPASRQRGIMAEVVLAFNDDVGPYLGVLHQIEAWRFMGSYDDMPLSYADSLSDQTLLRAADRFIILGKYIGCQFPEVDDQPGKGFGSIDDFQLSQGSPCMSFRDEERQATYVVPIDAITKITTIEEYEET